MEKYDFLLIYEVKNREFDSLCLLKYELDRRGYKTKISNTIMLKEKPEPVDAKVVVMPSLYSTITVMLARPFVKKLDKIVNLQWEQVFYRVLEQKKHAKVNNRYNVTGLAKRGAHISWGPQNYKRLVQHSGLKASHVCQTGHIALDFMRPEFSDYYIDRNSLLHQFDLTSDQKIILFISSFVYVHAAESRIKRDAEVQGMTMPEFMEFVQITQKSQSSLLTWFDHYLKQNPNETIIYRPHPAEIPSPDVISLSASQPRFRIIRDYSVQQWIRTADVVFNWFSTSLIEIIRAHKPNYLLRPDVIPDRFDYPIMKSDSKYIKTEEQFIQQVNQQEYQINLEDTTLPEHYWYDEDKPTYKYIVDYLEKVYKEDQFKMRINPADYALYYFGKAVKMIRVSYRYRSSQLLQRLGLGDEKTSQILKGDSINQTDHKKQMINYNQSTQDEIMSRIEKIRSILAD